MRGEPFDLSGVVLQIIHAAGNVVPDTLEGLVALPGVGPKMVC